MNAGNASAGQHPAPKSESMGLAESFFAVFAGPLAWFVQLTAGFALATQPCFSGGDAHAPTPAAGWTHTAMVALVAACCMVALLASLVSWWAYQRTGDEGGGNHRHLLDVGTGRTRFLALWGVILGGGSAVVTLFTAVALVVLPRCGG